MGAHADLRGFRSDWRLKFQEITVRNKTGNGVLKYLYRLPGTTATTLCKEKKLQIAKQYNSSIKYH